MDNDASLLRRYVDEGSQAALAELVRRNMDLVYSAALRRTGGDAQGAADVAQQVFVSLARHSRKLVSHPALAAWLHAATRNAAITFMKAEQRRRHLEHAAAVDPAIAVEKPTDWATLQPVIDEALDELSVSDRISIVLRFFQQASFRDVAAVLGVSEDAARMRTDRALEKLRGRLVARGVTSTAAAIGLLLGQQAVFAAPAGVAVAAIAQASAVAPAAASGIFGFLLMTKLTASLASGVIAAGLTAGAWLYFVPGVTADELDHLRSENQRLVQATGPAATDASLEAIAREYTDGTSQVARLVRARFDAKTRASAGGNVAGSTGAAQPTTADSAEKPAASGHRDHGLATPRDSFLTFAWASDSADVDALARMIWLDPETRQKAIEVMAQQPKALVAEYPTPEQFYAFITAALCLQAPPPGSDILELKFDSMKPRELRPGRLAFPNNYEFQQTEQGWKWVLPEVAVTRWLHVLNDSVLTKPAAK
jgi:RNA polymerase sigma factor (sigma-70 family)